MRDRSIAIVGAGVAGLAAGCYAQMNGYQTRIYEMHGLPGGVCTSWRRDGYVFDGCLQWLMGTRPGSPLNRVWQELGALTGWSVVPVPMLIPDHVFFWHLANRRFPAGNFIRTRETFDYIQEPDVFHDVFGHVPMLTDAVYADYMQEYGRAGWKAMRYNRLKALGALYWYTVEFGLIEEADGVRAYGAGILSGPTEARFAVEAESPNRIMLNVDRVMRTDYVISDLQPTYFVIESFADLYRQTVERDFDRLYRSLPAGFTYANSAVIDVDNVLQRGTQEYHLRGGRGSGAAPV